MDKIKEGGVLTKMMSYIEFWPQQRDGDIQRHIWEQRQREGERGYIRREV